MAHGRSRLGEAEAEKSIGFRNDCVEIQMSLARPSRYRRFEDIWRRTNSPRFVH